MKIIFAGTPDFAAQTLRALSASRHEVILVLTQPDRPAGRGMQMRVSAVKQFAEAQGIPIRQPKTLKDEAEQAVLAGLVADVMVVVAFGLILPQAVLDAPRLGAINIHASLLPRWRGAAPIQRALLAGDVQTGVSIMQMDAGLDTGPVYLAEDTPITDADNSQTLHDRLAEIGARLILKALDLLDEGSLHAVPQPEVGVVYAAKIDKAEARIDWGQDAGKVALQIRAFNPNPGAHFRIGQTEVKVWQASVEPHRSGNPGEILAADASGLLVACGRQALRLEQLQKAGGKRLAAMEFLKGFQVVIGETAAS